MRVLRAVIVLMLAWGLAACGGKAAPNRTGTTMNKLYTVSYEPNPDPIPFSTLFALNVTIKDAKGQPVDNAMLGIKVLMPAHGHGMQTTPEISGGTNGQYVVDGMKFHMHGDWQITFTVDGPAGTDTIQFDEDYE